MTKDQFDPESNYDHFYSHHRFEPFPVPFDCHEVLPRAGWTLDIANEIKAKSLLDLCCLDGFVALTLAKHCGTLEDIVGVDLSEPGISRAKDLSLQFDNPEARRIEFNQESVEDYLNRVDEKFDMILMFEAIEHFKDTPYVIKLCKQHLNPGGRVLISTPDAEEFYGIGNDDACHLQYYSHKSQAQMTIDGIVSEWEGRPIISLPDEIESLGGTVVDDNVFNYLIHLSATFS
jgi:2-polyprenyl-3-methyl-5-hydroxy-6-metoxy-1,4-benzoquinol methylase